MGNVSNCWPYRSLWISTQNGYSVMWAEFQEKINGLEKMNNCYIKSYNLVRAAMFGKKPTFVQWLISQRSTPHVHDEFQFSARHDNISFSATMMYDAKCARFKQITYSHPERWDTVIVPMTDDEEDLAWAEAKRLLMPSLLNKRRALA